MWSAAAKRSGDAALAPREALPSCWCRLDLEEKRSRRVALAPSQRLAIGGDGWRVRRHHTWTSATVPEPPSGQEVQCTSSLGFS